MRLPKFIAKPYRLRDYRFSLVILVTVLSFIGILVVGSAKESLQNKQTFGVVAGIVIMLVVSMIDYVWVLDMYWLVYIDRAKDV